MSYPIEAMPNGPSAYVDGAMQALENNETEVAQVNAALALASAVTRLAEAIERAATATTEDAAIRRRRWPWG
jgi:hypothetical protein